MKLRFKLPLFLIPLMIAPLLLLSWIAFDRMKENAEENMFRQMATLTEQIVVNSETLERTSKANAALLSGTTLLKNYLFTSIEDRYYFALLPLVNLFASYHNAYPYYNEIRVVLPDGYEDARFSSYDLPNISDNEKDSIWFRSIKETNASYLSIFQWNPDTGKPTIVVAHRLMFVDPTFEDSSEVPPSHRGYLAITVNLNALRRQILNTRMGNEGGFFILDPGGRSLFSDIHGIAVTSCEALLTAARTADADNITLAIKLKGKDMLIRARSLPGGLMLVGYLPESELAMAGEELRMIAIIIGFVVIILSVGLLMVFLQILIITPLNKLGAGAESIGRGNLQTRLEIRGKDEVAQLAAQFNNMARGLIESRKMNEKVQSDALKLKESAIESLRAADRLKDEFLANTSHELRTPLHGITGLAESLIGGVAGPMPLPAQENLRLIIASGRRLTNLVNDILDFSKLKHKSLQLVKRPVDLKSACDLVISMVGVLAEPKGIIIKNNVDIDIPEVMADENRLHQILYNLIGNAIKFTDEGYVAIRAIAHNEMIKIQVEDTGRGILDTEREIIFKSFEQLDSGLDRSGSGTGIGLAITRQLVESHGGKIEVTSRNGGGSVFTFTLPRVPEDKRTHYDKHPQTNDLTTSETGKCEPKELSSLPAPVLKNDKPDQGAGHVLVVDDEPVNLRVIENHLRLNGYKVTSVCSGGEALTRVLKHDGNFDLILLDIMMPGQSGYQVCEVIRKTYTQEQLPVIFLTALTRDGDLEKAFAVGGNDYIPKPFSYKELLTRIRLHLVLSSQSRDLTRLNNELEAKVKSRTQALELAYADMERLASIDGLTGVSNRRALDKALEQAWEKSSKNDRELSLVIMDIDNFKAYNDTYGHPSGDKCLRTVAENLTRIADQYDGFIGRYGGEEFSLILPLPGGDAFMAAESARSEIESLALPHRLGQSGVVTISAGVSVRSKKITSIRALINAADEALYLAKESGRNRVELS